MQRVDMAETIVAAVVQMNSGEEKAANYASAERLVRAAAAQDAALVVLPEYFNCLGDRRAMLAAAEPLDGPTASFLRSLAKSLRITLVGGTFCEQTGDGSKAHNTCLVVDPRGEVAAVYRKLHLFDVDLPGRLTYCESSWLEAGGDVVTCNAVGFRAAIAICYDVRFPELFRRFADEGVEVVAFPSAFTKQTGRDHWELLLRARAVENQCYVVAANQTGRHAALETYGHSLIVDPWGAVTVDAGEDEGIVTAPLSHERIAAVRAQLPALRHRRLR
jgi:predicted amidohydrolase